MKIYINGIRANKNDTARLEQDLRRGLKAKGRITKKGNISITTEI